LRPYRLAVSQLAYDLRKLRSRWREAQLEPVAERMSRELAKVNHLEALYWQIWERSRQSRLGHERDGDLAALAGVQWCIERRRRLLGLETSRRQEVDHVIREYVGVDLASV
jgi:hypothetical protein